MNLNSLRTFAAVVEHRGFSRAAEAIHLSQPAVSKAVRLLERQAGMELIDRRPGEFHLTDAGAALYEHAQAIFALERAAEEELKARRGLERGVVRIAASTTIATYYLPPLLGTFSQQHPGIELRLRSANTREVVEALRAWELDIALGEGPVNDERVEVLPWREEELVVIAPANHPLAGRETVEPGELETETFLVREPGSGTREVADAALRAHGIGTRAGLQLGSTEGIKQAVVAGLGLAVVARAAISESLALGTLVALPVRGLSIRRTLSRLVLRGRIPSRAARAFELLLTEDTPPRL